MPTFRCYFLDENDHIRAAEVFDAATRDEAIEKATASFERSQFQAIEIWDGATKVWASGLPRSPPTLTPELQTESDN